MFQRCRPESILECGRPGTCLHARLSGHVESIIRNSSLYTKNFASRHNRVSCSRWRHTHSAPSTSVSALHAVTPPPTPKSDCVAFHQSSTGRVTESQHLYSAHTNE